MPPDDGRIAAAAAAVRAARAARAAAAAAAAEAAAARHRVALAAERREALRTLSARIDVRASVVAHSLTDGEARRRAWLGEAQRLTEPEPEPEPSVLAWRRCVATIGAERGGTFGQQHRALTALYRDALRQPERDPTTVMLDAGAQDTFPLRPVSVAQWRFLCAALSVKYPTMLPDPEAVEGEQGAACGGARQPEWEAIKSELASSIGQAVVTAANGLSSSASAQSAANAEQDPRPAAHTLTQRWGLLQSRSTSADDTDRMGVGVGVGVSPVGTLFTPSAVIEGSMRSQCKATTGLTVDAAIEHTRQQNASARCDKQQ
jgi:hypothetical protein